MNAIEQKIAAEAFAERWFQNKGHEDKDSRSFWIYGDKEKIVKYLFELYSEAVKKED